MCIRSVLWFWKLQVDVAFSVNNVPIRLTDERWGHIVGNKPYMSSYYEKVLEAVENPTWILRGYAGALDVHFISPVPVHFGVDNV